MLALLALALDAGNLFSKKQRMQNAADAGALAGALELARGPRGQSEADAFSRIETMARSAVQKNGFAHDNKSVIVTVKKIKKGEVGTCVNTASAQDVVEVIVQQPSHQSIYAGASYTLQACALAAMNNTTDTKPCMIALVPSGRGIDVSNNANIYVPSCGISVKSNGNNALDVSNNVTITAGSIDVAGEASIKNNASVTPSPKEGVSPDSIVDPISGKITPPDIPSGVCDYTPNSPPVGNALYPGVYCGGISFKNNVNKTFAPGNYILLGGGFEVKNNATINSNGGVMFYNTCLKLSTENADCPHVGVLPSACVTTNKKGGQTNICKTGTPGALDINNNVTGTFYAPSSGPYKNIFFYGDPEISGINNTINNNAALCIQGIMYIPLQNFSVENNGTIKCGNSPADAAIIANTISFGNNTNYFGLKLETIADMFDSVPGGGNGVPYLIH